MPWLFPTRPPVQRNTRGCFARRRLHLLLSAAHPTCLVPPLRDETTAQRMGGNASRPTVGSCARKVSQLHVARCLSRCSYTLSS
ncbi:hypothetical protein GY45DRAFT_350538 [Cubamyces sp. BRFM 1775]|nr:hypothetical protein GY45DRAFT_350538 [Cubamyces sp. BRFM 1775]